MSYYSVPISKGRAEQNSASSSLFDKNIYEDLDNLSLPPPPLPDSLNQNLQQQPHYSNTRTGGSFLTNQRQPRPQSNQDQSFPLPPSFESGPQEYPSQDIRNENIYTNIIDKFHGFAVNHPHYDQNKNRINDSSSYYNKVNVVNPPLDDNNYQSQAQNIVQQQPIVEPPVCFQRTPRTTVSSAATNNNDHTFSPPKSVWSPPSASSSYDNRDSLINSGGGCHHHQQQQSNRAYNHQNQPKHRQQSPIYANTLNLPKQSNTNPNIAATVSHNRPSPNIKNYLRFNRSSTNKQQKEEEVDHLTDLLVKSMENSDVEPDFFGMCNKCGEKVVGEGNGCTAMEKVFHIQCFTCNVCASELRGKPFYAMENKPHCEECYLNTLEKCSICEKPILDRILRATGKPYHPKCFTCIVCQKCLDGIPFTVDESNQIHCIDCFHSKFAPRCSVCNEPIVPETGKTETVRVVALDKSFHVSCYKCEDCDLLLSSEVEGRGCYPLDDHILCRGCNAKRVQAITAE